MTRALLALAAACAPPPEPEAPVGVRPPFARAEAALAVVNDPGEGPWLMAKRSSNQCDTGNPNFYCVRTADEAETLLNTFTFLSVDAERLFRYPNVINISDATTSGRGDKTADVYELDDFCLDPGTCSNNVGHLAMSWSGYVKVPNSSGSNIWTFAVGSDDGYRLRIHNGTSLLTDQFAGGRAFNYGNDCSGVCQHTFSVTFPNAGGMFPFELVWFENTGAAGVEWVVRQGFHLTYPGLGATQADWALIPRDVMYGPDLRATMYAEKVGGGVVASGDTIKWTMILRNVGQTPAYTVQQDPFPGFGGVPGNALAFLNCMDPGITWGAWGAAPSGVTLGTTTTGCASTRAYALVTQPIAAGAQTEFSYTTTVAGNAGDYICDIGFVIGSTTENATIGKQKLVRYTDDPSRNDGAEATNSLSLFEANANGDDDVTCVRIGEVAPPTTITAPTAGQTVVVARPSATGTARTGASVRITWSSSAGRVTCTATADAGGNWSCTPAQDLADGAWTVSAHVQDNFGSIGPTVSVGFTVDALGPAKPVLNAVTSPTADTTPDFAGTADAGVAVAVLEGTATLCSTAASGAGAFACTAGAALGQGSHTVKARATDGQNRTNDSDDVTFVVDSLAPGAPALSAPPAATDDATPTFAGTAEQGTTVKVMEGTTLLCTATAGGGGAFSCDSTVTLTDGSHTVTVTATDAAGNASPGTARTFTVDGTPPPKPTLNPVAPTPTGDNTPSFSGTAEAGAAVAVMEGAATVCSATAGSGAGAFSCTAAAAMSDGSHTVKARATDAFNRAGPDSDPVTFVVDTAGPAAPTLTSPPAATSDSTPLFSGTTEPGASVRVVRGGDTLCTATADGNGNFSCESTLTLADGLYVVQVTARDAVGNDSPAAQRTFTVDTVAPARPRVDAVPSPTALQQPVLAGSCESNMVVVVRERAANGTLGAPVCQRQAVGTTWSCAPTAPLADGAHTLEAEAQDGAGNRSAACPQGQACDNQTTFTVDTQKPAAPVFDAVASPVQTVPPLAGSAEAGSRVRVHEGTGQPFCNVLADAGGRFLCPSQFFFDGIHTVLGNAADAAGNVSADGTLSFTVDGNPPAAPVLDPIASPTRNAQPAIAGSAEAGAKVRVFEGTALVCTATAASDFRFSCSSATAFADGPHTLTAESQDAAGGVSPRSTPLTFVVDTIPPGAPVLEQPASPTPVKRTVFSGRSEAAARVTVKEGSIDLCTATAGADGAFICTSFELSEGNHGALAGARDAAGNEGPPSNAVGWTIDTTPPPTPSIEEPEKNAKMDALGEVRGRAREADRVELYLDGGKFAQPASIDADGNWLLAPAGGFLLEPGAHTVAAIAVDGAGNRSAQSPAVPFTVTRVGRIYGGGCSCGPGVGAGGGAWALFGVLAFVVRIRRRR